MNKDLQSISIGKEFMTNHIINFIDNIPNDLLRKTFDSSSKEYIHDLQIDAAKEINKNFFSSDSTITMVMAAMQGGKTDCCSAFINIVIYLQDNYKNILKNEKFDNLLKYKNFIYFTGMNGKALKEQTIDRFEKVIAYSKMPDYYNEKEELEHKFYMANNYNKLKNYNATSKNFCKLFTNKIISEKDFNFFDNHFNKFRGKLIPYTLNQVNDFLEKYNDILKYENSINKYNFDYYKNSDLKKLLKNGNISIENTFIFLDESQFGTNENNVFNKAIEAANIDFRNTIRNMEKNVYFLSISATPFEEQKAYLYFDESSEIRNRVVIPVGPNYVGISKYMEAGCIFDSSIDNDFEEDDYGNYPIIEKIKNAENTRLNTDEFSYQIIRVNNSKEGIIRDNSFIKQNFEVILLTCEENSIDYDHFNKAVNNKSGKAGKIELGIANKQKKPVIFLIKGAFRAGNTIEEEFKNYCRMVYDNSKGIEASLQGLVGRYCGYRKNLESYKNTIIYANLSHMQKYVDYFNSNFSDEKIPVKDIKKRKNEFSCFGLQGVQIEISKIEINKLKRLSDKLKKFGVNTNTSQNNPAHIAMQNRYEFIMDILKNYNLIQTDNVINNLSLNANNGFEYNYINKLLVNQDKDYKQSTLKGAISLTSLTSYEPDKNKKTKIGDIVINVTLIGNKFIIQRGIVKERPLYYVKKSKHFLISQKTHPHYKGPFIQNDNISN